MTTAFARSHLRDQNRALIATIEHGVASIDGALSELTKIRAAVAATSGGSSAALITSELSSWATTKGLLAALVAGSEALMTSQLGSGNAND